MKQEIHPWLIERYSPLFSQEEFWDFLKFCTASLRRAIRINTLRISLKEFELRAKNNKWSLEKIPYIPNWYFIEWDHENEALGKSIEYFCWLFYIQEASSMIPPIVLNPQKWDIILDVSAAPWSKSTQISTMVENDWLIIANDVVSSRIKALKTNINYQGMIACLTSKLDWRDFGRYFNEHFDKILLDAPCSWEGTMRKEKINWSLDVIHELASLQKRLISSALQALKIGGELVYSTCTMTPEEDELILDYIKKEFTDSVTIQQWKLEWLQTTPWILEWEWKKLDKQCQYWQKVWPHINNTEGFFIAKIIKNSEIKVDKISTYYPKKSTEKIIKAKELKILFSQISKRFWINKNVFSNYIIVKKGTKLEIRTKQSNSFALLPNIQSLWIPFWEEINNKFTLDFYSGQIFWNYATKNFVILTLEQTNHFIKWEDIQLKSTQIKNCLEWQLIIKYDWLILWTSLLQKNWKLKNQVPRETIKM